jgi:hypothetical protein
MTNPLLEQVTRINTRIAGLLDEARRALHGECVFGVAQVRDLSASVSEMAPVWAQAAELRVSRPELAEELDRYKSHLGDLHVTLRRVRLMLLAQRSQMEASREQLAAVSHWTRAFQQTR